jgi:hypothetical protein
MTPQLNPWDSDFPHNRAAATNTRFSMQPWIRRQERPFWISPNLETGTNTPPYECGWGTLEPN